MFMMRVGLFEVVSADERFLHSGWRWITNCKSMSERRRSRTRTSSREGVDILVGDRTLQFDPLNGCLSSDAAQDVAFVQAVSVGL